MTTYDELIAAILTRHATHPAIHITALDHTMPGRRNTPIARHTTNLAETLRYLYAEDLATLDRANTPYSDLRPFDPPPPIFRTITMAIDRAARETDFTGNTPRTIRPFAVGDRVRIIATPDELATIAIERNVTGRSGTITRQRDTNGQEWYVMMAGGNIEYYYLASMLEHIT